VSEVTTLLNNNPSSLIGGRRLANNVLWNVLGEVGPAMAALIATPILIHRIGTERFGVLALAWTVFGYLGLFDFGLSSAITKVISDRLGEGREDQIAPIFWTGLGLLAGLGLLGAAVLAASAPMLVHSLLRVPIALQPETLKAFYIIALGLPLLVSGRGLGALLVAHQRFDRINSIGSPNAIFSSIGPLLVLPFSRSLGSLVAVLFLGHTVAWAAYLVSCLKLVPSVRQRVEFRPELVPSLLAFGGWVTGANAVGLVMNTFDRFLLAAMISLNAVTYYMVPVRIIRKLRIVAGFVDSVLYPAFALSLAQNRERTRSLFDRGTKVVILLLFPVSVLLVMFAREVLTLWIGADFARASASVLQWLMVAVLAEGVAQIAESLTAAVSRPDLNAKLHALELPLYLALTVFMVRVDGAAGAAIAAAARAVGDMFAHLAIVEWILPDLRWPARRFALLMAGCGLVLAAVAIPMALAAKIGLAAAFLTGFAPIAWIALFGAEDRAWVRDYLSAMWPFAPVGSPE